jgi:hypothetical protein
MCAQPRKGELSAASGDKLRLLKLPLAPDAGTLLNPLVTFRWRVGKCQRGCDTASTVMRIPYPKRPSLQQSRGFLSAGQFKHRIHLSR